MIAARLHPGHRESGQAAVESALLLPLTLFLILGTLQLCMLQQSRIAAQYAAFQSTRVGSTSHGACLPMTHAALLTLVWNLDSFMGDSSLSGTAAERLAGAFARVRDNDYSQFRWGTWKSTGASDEAIVWLFREGRQPTAADVVNFDQPLQAGDPLRMELRLVYWAPLRIPFADWVYARIAAVRLADMAPPAGDPLLPTRIAPSWPEKVALLDDKVKAELLRRVTAGHYVFPIEVSSTMRMMTPPRLSEFDDPTCPAPGL